MILRRLRIYNFRSIKDSGEIAILNIFAFIGENNSGKSNLIRSLECLTSAGAGGVKKDDFNDPSEPIVIKGTFESLTPEEIRRWHSYLVSNQLILEKHFRIEYDERSGKEKVNTEFHGYRAEPKDWFLSIPKIQGRSGGKVNWNGIVEENGLPDYFLQDGKCNKTIFQKGLDRYLQEKDVEYDEPDISTTQALGLQSNVVATLPSVYVLRAITDYSDEIDKRTSTSTFRRLMGDLSGRILKQDPKYKEIQTALDSLRALLNRPDKGESDRRLESLSSVETRITELLKKLMPSVQKVSMAIIIEEMKDIFSSGVCLSVDDGVDTDVLAKGHGLQRCIVFTLLQSLIMNERNQLIKSEDYSAVGHHHIILAIEEPELYIHPQLCKLFYDVMKEFSQTDQVIYSTHSPLFIDAFEYDKIAIVKKPTVEIGTKVQICAPSAFEGLTEKKIFQGLTKLNPSVNEMFFARRVLLVEGPEDQIAITTVLQDEKMISNRTEELDWSIIVAGGKPSIPFFQRVLNGFSIPYVVLHDNDITPEMSNNDRGVNEKQNETINKFLNGNLVFKYPIKLETSLGLDYHFKDQYSAHVFFQNPANITNEVRDIIKSIFTET